MSFYTESVTITAPAPLAEVAARIARALDPDSGGAKSFHPDPDGKTISVTTHCTPEYRSTLLSMRDNPAALHAFTTSDWASRSWPGKPPTLAECESFCTAITIT